MPKDVKTDDQGSKYENFSESGKSFQPLRESNQGKTIPAPKAPPPPKDKK